MTGLPVAVIRPQPGNEATVLAARGLGLDARGYSLFSIEPLPWDCPDPAGFDGLAIGSANAVRHAGDQLARLRGLRVHAVGETTARAARDAGFTVVRSGIRDLADLLSGVPAPARLLRLAGEEHVVVTPPPGVIVESRITYTVRRLSCPQALAELLHGGCVVLLHSAAAARYFASECDRLVIARGRVALACLASRVAAAAGPRWRAVASAELPNDAALLALAARMCQTDA